MSDADFPRLVIDNNSPVVSGTPDRSANPITPSSHLPGIEPRALHIDTVERFTCSSIATAPVPPSASINSDAEPICFASMRDRLSQNVRFWNPQISRLVNSLIVNGRDSRFGREKHLFMTDRQYWQYDGAETLRRLDVALRERHHIDINQRGQTKQAAGIIGFANSTIPMWQKRGGVPLKNVGKLAERLEVRVEYLLAIDDDMGPAPTRSLSGPDVITTDMERRILDTINARFVEFDRRLSKLEKAG